MLLLHYCWSAAAGMTAQDLNGVINSAADAISRLKIALLLDSVRYSFEIVQGQSRPPDAHQERSRPSSQ